MDDSQAELLSRLYTLAWSADRENDTEAKREIDRLCQEHPFLARERARMVKERQKAQVALARRARRGEPLVPVKVVSPNGRIRQCGLRVRSGHAPRTASNTRHRGSRRTTAPTRAGPSDSGDPHQADEPPGERRFLIGGRR